TLETGIRLLDKKMEETKAAGKTTISGVDAFTLYDTYGFPLDLTELILREHGMDADIEEFNVEMQKQKERARNAAAVETGDWVILKEGETEFVGYDFFEYDAEILRYRQVKQKNKVLYQIVLDKTPFYAEMGGQVGDTGWLINGDEKIVVIDTKRENNLPIHLVEKLPQDVSAVFTAKIDAKKRIQCECNHSATHLLHEALREVLGAHVEQKGSYVSPSALRFDFSHYQKVTDEEIRKVERLVGEKIRANYPLEEHRNMPIEEAKKLGAMALFGEKYGDNVRVVKYGTSIELCGGTHIPATGMIGSLRVVGESSVAAGIRRIEAVTAEAAEDYTFVLQDSIRELRAMFNNVPNLALTIRKSIEENAELKKQINDYVKEKVQHLKKELVANAQEKNGVKVIVFKGNANVEVIKDLAFQIKGEAPMDGKIFFVGGIKDGAKCALMVALSEGLVKEGLHAGKLVKDAAKHIQGGGGGQPHFATAGGKNPEGLDVAVDSILESAGLK
ncbi:MAG: alanine--tRNA ligase-related protein, partial [Parabacteroides sp.]|nr:alanine--tRNA ligase-related protein [Parabacteroides sp.]